MGGGEGGGHPDSKLDASNWSREVSYNFKIDTCVCSDWQGWMEGGGGAPRQQARCLKFK